MNQYWVDYAMRAIRAEESWQERFARENRDWINSMFTDGVWDEEKAAAWLRENDVKAHAA